MTTNHLPATGAQSPTKTGRAKWARWTLIGVAASLLGTGCSVYPTGYGRAYYEPDYSPYYSSYGYGGAPFFGGVYGGDIVVGGSHHHGYYGGHHFGHDFHGGGGGHGHR